MNRIGLEPEMKCGEMRTDINANSYAYEREHEDTHKHAYTHAVHKNVEYFFPHSKIKSIKCET